MSGLSLSRYLHLTHIKLDFRTLLSLTFLVLFFSESVFCEEYLNKFAVEIRGGRSVADSVAAKHGFRNEGEIFEGHYIFSHEHVHRRSANPSHEHHNRLSEEPEVRWVEQQKLLVRKKRDFQAQKSDLHFVDPLYNKMWYFLGKGVNHTDMNVQRAWSMGYTGKRIVISILDDGIERTHEDLKYNYDPGASYDVNSKDNDPMPRYDYSNENRHGTRCAGEVSARANNTKCGVGVAPDSRIGGVRMLDGDVYDGVEAQSLSFNRTHIDIYSASWGPDDDGRVVDGPGPLAKKAFADGILQGRGGKGNIFVWASGNGGSSKDSCNCDGYTNSIFTLSVSSISQLGKKPWYLEECASTLTTTYSSGGYSEKQIITTDLHNRCTETHTGTSASAPLAGGVVALALEANPDMTWRDVQYITLMTSRPIGDGPWVTNGVGRKVSLRYGYGLMDASAMVDLALKWRNVPEQHKCEQASQTENMQVPDDGYSENLDTTGCAGAANEVNYLEHVQAKITLKSKARGDLVIHLVSPMGTRSTILPQRPNDRDHTHGFKDWAFLSVQFWGENPAGRWMLEIEVKAKHNTWSSGRVASAETTNHLVSWSLIMYGTEENPVNLKGETASTPTPSLTPIPTGECHRECANGCTGPANTQCKGCKNLRILTTGACVSACPEGFYKQNFQCKPCDTNCVQCTAVSQSDVMCLRCKPGYLFQEGEDKCVKYCATGYYEAATTPAPKQRSDIDCKQDAISVFVPGQILPSSGNATWHDPSCVVGFNGSHFVATIGLNDCGTTVKLENDSVVFENELVIHKTGNGSSFQTQSNIITYGNDYDTIVPVACVYPRSNNITTSYIPIRHKERFFEKRYGNLDLSLTQYESSTFTAAVPFTSYPRKVPLHDDVFIRLGLEHVTSSKLGLHADRCIATSSPSPADTNWYPLLTTGCPTNNDVKLLPSGTNEVKFQFKAFDFTRNSTGFVYVHCQVSVCQASDPACVTGCQTRGKRAAEGQGSKSSHLVSTGPFLVVADEAAQSVPMATVFGGVCLAVAVLATVVAILGWTRKGKSTNGNAKI